MSKEVSHKSFGVHSEIYLVSMNPKLQLILLSYCDKWNRMFIYEKKIAYCIFVNIIQ